jgi:uncharacterized protein (DUF427 family)
MALRMGKHLAAVRDMLCYHPSPKRIRVSLDDHLCCDTTSAMLVWEPRRVVPMYAVPRDDLDADLSPTASAPLPDELPPFLGPEDFAVHSCPGQSYDVTAGGHTAPSAAFVPDDPDLGGRVVLDFPPFTWVEEGEAVMGHPHDPFKRIDVLASDRRVVVSHGDEVLAETTDAMALFETTLPTRWYLPRDDVRLDLLTPSDTRSVCAYKGQAEYFSLRSGAVRDIAWTYPDPLHDALRVKGMICFYAERADHTLDDVRQDRPVTPWSDPDEWLRAGRRG